MIADSALEVEREPEVANGRKVLVAEDSSITHDLLKLLLQQRGHHVDVVSSGRQALQALRSGSYDVALLDFHLPDMNGAEIATEIHRNSNGLKRPQLIAITADMEGLLASEGCEYFDRIIPKPLDIYQVGKMVEERADIADRGGKPSKVVAPAGLAPDTMGLQPQKFVKPNLSIFANVDCNVLVWPDDLDQSRLSARAMQAVLGDPRFDAIVIKEPASRDDLSTIWSNKALHVLPVIDLTGTLGSAADMDASKLGKGEAAQLVELFRRFHDQRAKLHKDLLFSDSPGEKLLGRMFVSERPLTPSYDPLSRSVVSYNALLQGDIIAREARAYSDEGLLKQTFFDRFHVCSRCGSSRVHVREECPECRSSSLTEESYLHHFSCAYQGHSSEFRSGQSLVCPKCRRELTHFGFDYDRPGSMLVCGICNHASSEPAIGILCLDCGVRDDSGAVKTRDAFTYSLTEQGRGFARYGHSFLGKARQALRFAELPIELIVALNAVAKQFNDSGTPFTLINIFYQNERDLTAEHGARLFAQARDLFIENVRGVLLSSDTVIKGQSYDFALLSDIGPEQSKQDFDLLRQAAQATVRFDLGVRFQAFGPKDIA